MRLSNCKNRGLHGFGVFVGGVHRDPRKSPETPVDGRKTKRRPKGEILKRGFLDPRAPDTYRPVPQSWKAQRQKQPSKAVFYWLWGGSSETGLVR